MKVKALASLLTFALLILTACSDRSDASNSDSVNSVTPEPSSQIESSPPSLAAEPPTETESQPTSAEETLPPEGSGQFKAFADELNTTYRVDLLGALGQWLYELRNGTFEEIPNHHPSYPSDFPPASDLPVVEKNLSNIFILWREDVQKSEDSWYEGGVTFVIPIDESHLYILDPAKFTDEDGNTTIGFGSSGFFAMTMEEFLAQSADHPWNQVPHDEPDYTLSAVFAIGPDLQDEKTLRIGDQIGEWKLSDLQIEYDNSDAINFLEAVFEGEMTLNGTISRNALVEYGYVFEVAKEDEAKMPHYIAPERAQKDSLMFVLDFSGDTGEAIYLEHGEEASCNITISDYRSIFAYMTAPDGATVVDIEVLQ